METHHHPSDVETHPDVSTTTSVRERWWGIAPGQIVSLVAGLGFLTVGIIAVLRAGLGDDLSQPVVEVLGLTHTAWLGLIEIAVGLVLTAAGADFRARGLSAFVGTALVVAGIVIAAAAEDLPEELGIEEGMGGWLIVVGAVVAISALVFPAWRGRALERHHVEM